MAGDWVPCVKDLEEKPQFGELLVLTKLSLLELHYALITFWGWADSHTEDGHFPKHTAAGIYASLPLKMRMYTDKCPQHRGNVSANLRTNVRDASTTVPEVPPFLAALEAVGWLIIGEDCVTVPEFDVYMGKSAKKRLKDCRRKRHNRMVDMSDVRNIADKLPQDRGQKRDNSVTTQHNTTMSNTNPQTPFQGANKLPSEEEEENATALHGQTLDEIRGTKKESPRVRACDRPDLFEVARRIVNHYEKVVAPTSAARVMVAVDRVVQLLATGNTEEQLTRAADGYAARLAKGKPDAIRQAAQTFYGPKGSYAGLVDYTPPEIPTRAPIPKLPRPSATTTLAELRRKAAQDDPQGKESQNGPGAQQTH